MDKDDIGDDDEVGSVSFLTAFMRIKKFSDGILDIEGWKLTLHLCS